MATLLERIEAKYQIVEETSCWVWTASTDAAGYARIAIGNYKYRRAHRALYELLYGQVPEGLVLDHLCKNRSCVNPSHLEPVTQKENVRRGKLVKHICEHGNPMSTCEPKCRNRYIAMWRKSKKKAV